MVGQIVGRRELAQVIAETLRDRRTRKPYLLIGGVGAGKTAALVELTQVLAEQQAVPVPIQLRDAAADGELDFEEMAKRRFLELADQSILSSTQGERTWRQLRMDDKVVVLADGLEEAVQDEQHRDDRDNIIRRAIDRANRQGLPLVIASRPHTPLESAPAAIMQLEPLSEEAVLEYSCWMPWGRRAESSQRGADGGSGRTRRHQSAVTTRPRTEPPTPYSRWRTGSP
jgi:hypothetical protein